MVSNSYLNSSHEEQVEVKISCCRYQTRKSIRALLQTDEAISSTIPLLFASDLITTSPPQMLVSVTIRAHFAKASSFETNKTHSIRSSPKRRSNKALASIKSGLPPVDFSVLTKSSQLEMFEGVSVKMPSLSQKSNLRATKRRCKTCEPLSQKMKPLRS